MKLSNSFLLIFFLTVITQCGFTQILPASRSTNWKLAGYPGNIPVYNTVKNIIDYGGNSNGVISNDAALQNAVNSLNNQDGIIYFPAGTFVFNQPVSLRSGIVLKGDGALNSILAFNLGGNFSLINVFGTTSSVTANITSTVLKEAASFIVDNVSFYQAGDYIKVFQNDSALVNDSWALGSVGQIVRIDSIKNNSIYFSNPLRRNYLLINSPKIIKLEMVSGVGIECLKIKRLDATLQQTANIRFTNATHCWVKGVESDSCNFAHIKLETSTNIEITNNYFHGAFAYGAGGVGYGISCEYTSGECLIENNIFQHLRHSMLLQSGANGNVFAYNYSLDPFQSDLIPNNFSGDIVLHGNYPYLNLFEGNIVQNIVVDASHGKNGPFNTLFRNRAELYGLFVSQGTGDSTNIIGNEITGRGFQQGNYYAFGSGILQYANNKQDTIIPIGTSSLADKSYLYNNAPGFWNATSLWSSIGVPYHLLLSAIPAKQRFNNITERTYCLAATAVEYRFSGNGNWNNTANWSNNIKPPLLLSEGSEIIIDPPALQKCILNIPYIVNPGVRLTISQGKIFEIGSNLTFVK